MSETTEWTLPIDDVPGVFADRLRRATTAMADADVRTAVFVSCGRHLFTDMDPVIWLTGFKPMRAAVALATDDGEMVLYTQGEWEAERARRVAGGPTVVAADDPFRSAAADLAARAGQRVGTAGTRKLNTIEHRSLPPGADYQLVAIDAELDQQARHKDRLELVQFRRASEIAEIAFDALREQLRIGMTDVAAEAIIERRLRELGADDAFVFLSAAARNRAVQRPWGRVLMPGDIMLTELSPCVGGVFSQICRTVAIGEPGAALARDHKLLVEVLSVGLGECKAGRSVADVVAAMDAPLIGLGLEQYTKPPFMRVRGHGMGFGSVAPGDFVSTNRFVLETGDSFVLHPNQMLPGAGYLMCGEPVIVNESGGEVVTAGIAELEIVEAR